MSNWVFRELSKICTQTINSYRNSCLSRFPFRAFVSSINVTISHDSTRALPSRSTASFRFSPRESDTSPCTRRSVGHASAAWSVRPVAPPSPGAWVGRGPRSRAGSWVSRRSGPGECGPPSSLGPCLQIECRVSLESRWGSLQERGTEREERSVSGG